MQLYVRVSLTLKKLRGLTPVALHDADDPALSLHLMRPAADEERSRALTQFLAKYSISERIRHGHSSGTLKEKKRVVGTEEPGSWYSWMICFTVSTGRSAFMRSSLAKQDGTQPCIQKMLLYSLPHSVSIQPNTGRPKLNGARDEPYP